MADSSYFMVEQVKHEIFFFWFLKPNFGHPEFVSSLQFCKKNVCGSPKGTGQQNSVLWSVEGRKNNQVSQQ